MQVSKRHIGLILGITTVLGSYLFFGRQQETYQMMLLGGLLISGICILWILFGRGTIKSKLLWSTIVALGVVLNWLTESYFIDSSYRIYIRQFTKELNETNYLLKNKPGEIWIMNDSILVKNGPTLEPEEKQQLLRRKMELGTYMISKTDSTIYYGLWGFLDVRIGLTYVISGTNNDERYRHLTGKWFR